MTYDQAKKLHDAMLTFEDVNNVDISIVNTSERPYSYFTQFVYKKKVFVLTKGTLFELFAQLAMNADVKVFI